MMKSHRTQAGMMGLFLLMIIGGLTLVTCDEAPFEPNGNEPVEPKDYKVWLYQQGTTHKLIAYHPLTGEMKTTEVPSTSGGSIAVSPDGELLYLPIEGAIAVLDTDSLRLVRTLPYDHGGLPWSKVVPSNDSEYLAIIGRDSLWILDKEYNRIHAEPFSALTVVFSADSRTLYAANLDVLVIKLGDSTVDSHVVTVPSHSVIQAIPTQNQAQLLTNSYIGFDRWIFEVFDIAADSNVFGQLKIPGGGFMAMSPDGQYAYLGNPGSIIVGTPGTSDLMEFDISTQESNDIPVEYQIDSVSTVTGRLYEIVITPDNRWLVAIDGPDQTAFWTYDRTNKEFTDFRQLSFELIRNCAVQSNL